MTLVVMAAGLGSRYGGCKQIAGVGPAGEILLEYAVFDAVRAGFTDVVFIIKEEMRAFIDELCAGSLSRLRTAAGAPVPIRRVYQDGGDLPELLRMPAGRTKPMGTVHAVLCAESAIRGPFAVLNADDFYGPAAFPPMLEALAALPERGEAAMVGYRLKNTVSPHGSVTRGVCAVEGGVLRRVTETYHIRLLPDGSIRDGDGAEGSALLDPETPVSMNYWGFAPSVFEDMRAYYAAFREKLAPGDGKSECLLPVMIDELINTGRLTVRAQETHERWFGMTYPEDRAIVAEELKKLHAAGVYPPTLR